MTKPLEHTEEDKEGSVDEAVSEANRLERDTLFRKEVASNLSMKRCTSCNDHTG